MMALLVVGVPLELGAVVREDGAGRHRASPLSSLWERLSPTGLLAIAMREGRIAHRPAP